MEPRKNIENDALYKRGQELFFQAERETLKHPKNINLSSQTIKYYFEAGKCFKTIIDNSKTVKSSENVRFAEEYLILVKKILLQEGKQAFKENQEKAKSECFKTTVKTYHRPVFDYFNKILELELKNAGREGIEGTSIINEARLIIGKINQFYIDRPRCDTFTTLEIKFFGGGDTKNLYNEMIAHYDKVIATNPYCGEAYYLRGIGRQKKALGLAISDFFQAAHLQHPEAESALRELLNKNKKEKIFKAIIALPSETATPSETTIALLKSCLDKTSVLGEKFYTKRGALECHLERGSLKKINEYLKKTGAVSVTTVGVFNPSTRSTDENRILLKKESEIFQL